MGNPTITPDVATRMAQEMLRQWAETPEVHFRTHRVPPSTFQYIGPDDFLQVSVYTTSTTSGLRLALRYLDPQGQMHYQQESLDGATINTLTTKNFRLTEGWLLGAAASNLGGGLADQVCFVGLALQARGTGNIPPHTVLAQGYVTNLFSVVWPPTMPRGPATGGGALNKAYADSLVDVPPTVAGSLDDEFDAATLSLTQWTWLNQGTATATLAASRVNIAIPISATPNTRAILQPVPATPWTVTAKLVNSSNGLTVAGDLVSIILVDAVSTNMVLFAASWPAAGLLAQHLYAIHQPGVTGAFVIVSDMSSWAPGAFYLRVQDDGTNIRCSYSLDGYQFAQVYTELRTSYMTNGAGKVGLAAYSNNNAQVSSLVSDWFRRTQ